MVDSKNILAYIKTKYPHYNEFQVVKMAMHLDMMYFAKICSKDAMFNKSPDFHYEIAKNIQDDRLKRINVISFRGSAKSTLISHILPMWKVCTKAKDEPCFILIVSESLDQSKNFLQRMKDELTENQKIKDYFGNLGEETAKRWQMDDIILANGARIKALGTGQKPRGVITKHTRPTLIIIDDFESETNAGTGERRIANRKWVTEAITPTLTPDGRIILVGTVISDDCFLLWAKEAKSWKTLEYSILQDDGTPAWSDRFSLAKIESIKQEYEDFGNLSGFYQEYMNQPQSPEDAPFKDKYFKYHNLSVKTIDGKHFLVDDENVLLEPCNLYLGVDLASSLSITADFTVFATVAFTQSNKYYLMDIVVIKADPAYHPDKLVELFLKHKHTKVGIETTGYQETMRTTVRRICEEKGLYIPGLESGLKPKNSKSERLLTLVPIFASGRFMVRHQDINVVKEFLAFPKGRHDDQMDAIWNCVAIAKKPYHSNIVVDKMKEVIKKVCDVWTL